MRRYGPGKFLTFGEAPMDIVLDLKRHCVETEIKRIHKAAVSACFRAGADQAQLEQTVDLTRQALQRFDFGFLRSRYLPLAGRSDAHARLTWREGRPVILLSGKPIYAAEKPKRP